MHYQSANAVATVENTTPKINYCCLHLYKNNAIHFFFFTNKDCSLALGTRKIHQAHVALAPDVHLSWSVLDQSQPFLLIWDGFDTPTDRGAAPDLKKSYVAGLSVPVRPGSGNST